jgi:beta-1,4-N-acetylglucosaminyltransferase
MTTGHKTLEQLSQSVATMSFIQSHVKLILFLSCSIVTLSTLILVFLHRLIYILSRPPIKRSTSHLLVVLGSGGHTAEMINILSSIPNLQTKFNHRTYLVSSGDGFSALKAKEFERTNTSYSIVTVRRARRVHQSFLTAPYTAILSLWDCLQVIQTKPDLILTNGPGTGVCVVIASIISSFFGQSSSRTIFIESWARVTTLSLSGRLLKPLVNRFLVQWPQLKEDRIEYIGPLVS